MTTSLPQKCDSFYASHVPVTLSECVVMAAEHGQTIKSELALLRGMLVKVLDDLKASNAKVGRKARAEILDLIKEIRATLKVESELTAREKGMLHPSALGIFGSMIVQIVVEALPDQEQRISVQELIETRISQLPVAKLA